MKSLLVVLSVLYAGAAAWMFGHALPAVTSACGTTPLDGRYVWGPVDAQAFFASWGADGMSAYGQLQTADLVYPTLLAATIIAWTWALTSPGPLRAAVVAAAVVNSVADDAENLAARILQNQLPGTWSSYLDFTPVITAVKNLTGAVALLGLALVVAIWASHRARRPDRSE